MKAGREQCESRAKEERGRECACVIGQQYAAGGAWLGLGLGLG